MPLDEHGGANLRTYASYTFAGRLTETIEIPKNQGANGGYYVYEHNVDYQSAPKGGWNGKGGVGLHGTTGEGKIMNPFETVYFWLRTA